MPRGRTRTLLSLRSAGEEEEVELLVKLTVLLGCVLLVSPRTPTRAPVTPAHLENILSSDLPPAVIVKQESLGWRSMPPPASLVLLGITPTSREAAHQRFVLLAVRDSSRCPGVRPVPLVRLESSLT